MPVTLRQWEDSLRQPALCELLPVRDYLDGCIIRTNGCFVAGYETSGLNTFFHADETRNRTKEVLEALVRSLPERSMRMQVRYEVTDGHGDLTERYVKEQRIENPVLQALDRERLRLWNIRAAGGTLPASGGYTCTSSGIPRFTTTTRISSGGRRARRRTSGACRRTNASSERCVNMRIACRSLKV